MAISLTYKVTLSYLIYSIAYAKIRALLIKQNILIFENPDGDVLVDLANLQHRVVADAYYLFT